MRFGWLGFHVEGLLALRALLQQGVPIQAVITLNEEQLAKRSGAINYRELASQFNVPFHAITNINDETSIRLLKELDLDVLFVLGWSQIVRPLALSCCHIGMVGAHASILPFHRGSAPINWALIHGEAETGNTLIWLSTGVDEGAIIDQVRFLISPYDTCASLYERVAESNRDMVLRLIPKLLRGERPGAPQPPVEGPVLPRRRPDDGRIEWSCDSRIVYNFIRALARPYPGAFSCLNHERWRVWQAALPPMMVPAGAVAGEVLGPVVSPALGACGQVIACGTGVVVVLELEDASGRILTGEALSDQPWQGRIWAHE